MSRLYGSMPSLITPFNKDYSIDFESFINQIDYVLNSGAHGICVNALLGEGYKLTEEEKRQILELTVKKVGNKIPIVNGVQASSAYIAIKLAEQSKKIGAQSLMITPPFFYTPSLKNIYDHFKAISDAVDINIMVQDAAVLVGTAIGVDMMKKMVSEIKNIKYLKLELSKPGPEVSIYVGLFGDKCPLIWGYGGLHFLEAFKRGSIGIIAGADFPAPMYKIYNYLKAGEFKEADELYKKYLPFFIFSMANGYHSQASTKKVLYWKGIIKTDLVREPAQPLDSIHEEELKDIMRTLKEI